MKKHFFHLFVALVSLVMAFTFALGACTPNSEGGHTEHVDADADGKCDECGKEMPKEPEGPEEPAHEHSFATAWTYDETDHWHAATCEHEDQVSGKAAHTFRNGLKCDVCDYTDPFTVINRADYAPQKFSGVTQEVTRLADGVHLVKNTMTLSDGKTSVVYTIEVDLSKAGIAAGTKDNATTDFKFVKTTPYAMAQAWEQATGGQVYASINADFFGNYCVNAFVKDGVIVKDGHNVGQSFDYKDDSSDVPASAPMLFGVKGDTAQIAPIMTVEGDPTDPAVKEQWVKAKLFYSVKNGNESFEVRDNATADTAYISYLTRTTPTSFTKGVAVKVDNTQGTTLKVLEIKEGGSGVKLSGGEGYGWLLTKSTSNSLAAYLSSLSEGDTVSFTVSSPDGAWNGFDTILGCRQALVLDGAVASTVTLENTNGAQNRDIPRTAVGLKPDGTVVLFAVESLWYGASKTADVRVDTDPHGLNLPELAEFVYYYGCDVAANFDGGGSTQLTVRGVGEETPRVLVRSSDFGIADVTKTRVVMNGFLITSKKA